MISVKFDAKAFNRTFKNVLGYSYGFLDGIQAGKPEMFANLGPKIKELLEQFIDANARINPEMLHHVYEWQRAGQEASRLFDINYISSGSGLSFGYSFSQSVSIKSGSRVPFYDKARIMEEGIPVRIAPKTSSVLVFEDNGETIFTKSPVVVENPGGQVAGQFDNTFKMFFLQYLSQSLLQGAGIVSHLKNPDSFVRNFGAGAKTGRSKGFQTGRQWVADTGRQ
jgi:hypothetical protein